MSATASCHQTRNSNDDWTSAKFLGKHNVEELILMLKEQSNCKLDNEERNQKPY